jgi:hypothetical protein
MESLVGLWEQVEHYANPKLALAVARERWVAVMPEVSV